MSRPAPRRRLPLWCCVLVVACSTTGRPPVQAQAASAESLQAAFTQAADRVAPSVVAVRIEQRRKVSSPFEDFFFGGSGPERFQLQRGTGSGVVMRADGHILTNKHVVENADRVEVVFRDGKKLLGKVVGIDDATDLAVVKVDAKSLTPATFADSSKVRPGQWAIAIGSPFGLDYTVTVGVVSAIGRAGVGMNEIEDYLQTDASINPGNSGGPLLNLRGEVIGINTMIIGGGTGIGFAIPSSIARSVAEQLIGGGRVQRAYIGVAFQELTAELAQQLGLAHPAGALVSSVLPGGPADQAGIKPGDVITSVDGRAIGESRDLLREIITKKIGASVQLGVVREGKPITLTLRTVERPRGEQARGGKGSTPGTTPDASLASVGLGLQPLTPELARQLGYEGAQGAVVAQVQAGSPAERSGLQQGDLIIEADRRAVREPGDVGMALSDGTALLRVRRRDGATYVVLKRD